MCCKFGMTLYSQPSQSIFIKSTDWMPYRMRIWPSLTVGTRTVEKSFGCLDMYLRFSEEWVEELPPNGRKNVNPAGLPIGAQESGGPHVG